MSAVNDAHSLGHVVDIVDKNCAFFGQLVDYEPVVHDLFADVDGSAKGVEGNVNDIDGAHHASTETARF